MVVRLEPKSPPSKTGGGAPVVPLRPRATCKTGRHVEEGFLAPRTVLGMKVFYGCGAGLVGAALGEPILFGEDVGDLASGIDRVEASARFDEDCFAEEFGGLDVFEAGRGFAETVMDVKSAESRGI
jgi:hypothetical protein